MAVVRCRPVYLNAFSLENSRFSLADVNVVKTVVTSTVCSEAAIRIIAQVPHRYGQERGVEIGATFVCSGLDVTQELFQEQTPLGSRICSCHSRSGPSWLRPQSEGP